MVQHIYKKQQPKNQTKMNSSQSPYSRSYSDVTGSIVKMTEILGSIPASVTITLICKLWIAKKGRCVSEWIFLKSYYKLLLSTKDSSPDMLSVLMLLFRDIEQTHSIEKQ